MDTSNFFIGVNDYFIELFMIFVELLLLISVFQRMKANHNMLNVVVVGHVAVANISISKNESKSQLPDRFRFYTLRCC